MSYLANHIVLRHPVLVFQLLNPVISYCLILMFCVFGQSGALISAIIGFNGPELGQGPGWGQPGPLGASTGIIKKECL